MLIQYESIDGFLLSPDSVLALMMTDTGADIDADQSGNSNDFTITGSPTTPAVATGAGTLALDSISGSNYLSRAYDADFDPGTTGQSGRCWFKHPGISASADFIFSRDSSPTAQSYRLQMSSTGLIQITMDDNTTVRTVSSPAALDDDKWHLASWTFDGTILYLYIDGVFAASTTGAALLTLNNATATFEVGRSQSGGSTWAGELAGLEIDIGNQWTAAWHQRIYKTEKLLFTDYEPFSFVGDIIDYEPELGASFIPQPFTKKEFTDTVELDRATINWGSKMQYNFDVVPFPRADIGKAKKFIRSTEGPQFVIDFEGSAATPSNPINVIKLSASEPIPNNTSWHQFSCQVREA